MAKSNMGFMAIILIILVVDGIGGYLIATKLLVPAAYEQPVEPVAGENAGADESPEGAVEFGFSRDLDAINLNPANSAGEVFSCQLTLESQTQEVIAELERRDQQIKDIILTYLSAKTIPELSDVTLRDEYRKDIIEKINAVLLDGRVTNLYITQWIIQ